MIKNLTAPIYFHSGVFILYSEQVNAGCDTKAQNCFSIVT